MLDSHDRAAVEVHCYDTQQGPDEVTARLKRIGHAWHHVPLVSDDALAQQIRSDGIDVLVDLAGHTSNNRLLVFARRPAPCADHLARLSQFYPACAIDYWFSDEHLDPTGGGSDQFASERIIRLPNTFACYGRSPTAARQRPARQIRRPNHLRLIQLSRQAE